MTLTGDNVLHTMEVNALPCIRAVPTAGDMLHFKQGNLKPLHQINLS